VGLVAHVAREVRIEEVAARAGEDVDVDEAASTRLVCGEAAASRTAYVAGEV